MLCHKCDADKPDDQFIRVARHYAVRERHHWCNACRNAYQRAYRKQWAQKYPDRVARAKKRARIRSYGLSVEQHEALLSSQDGRCAVCGSVPANRDLDVDHCHATKIVRGLLCNRCNKVLGQVKDDPDLLESLARYLREGRK